MIKIFFILLISGALFAKMVDGVAIVIEDEPITLYDIKQKMKQTHLGAKEAAELLIKQTLEKLEIQKRGLGVGSGDVYAEIKRRAAMNNMSVSSFYAAIRDENGLNSQDLKKLIKEQLLSQKLYNAIAYSKLTPPTDEEIQEYYKLHKEELNHPSMFEVLVYSAKDPALLQQQMQNPMFFSPKVDMTQRVLFYDKISPQLAQLLAATKKNRFTQIVPDGKGGYMTFYIKSITQPKDGDIKSLKPQIINAIMAKKRQTVLNDYFTKLRAKKEITIIRLP